MSWFTLPHKTGKKKACFRSGFFGGWGGVGVFKVEKIGIFFYNLDSKKKFNGFI
jgi:hypothetical protein